MSSGKEAPLQERLARFTPYHPMGLSRHFGPPLWFGHLSGQPELARSIVDSR